MDNLHKVQMQIIKELTFSPSIKFSKLNVLGISSDKFSYHLRKLATDELIQKDNDDYYSLTNKGKLYSSHMDTATEKIERLPKTSVLVIPIRELEEETGVTGLDFKHHFIIHEMVYNLEGKQLEDKFFNVVSFNNVSGEMLKETRDGKNVWVTEEAFRNMSPLFHNELDMLDWYLAGESGFKEEKYFIKEY